MIQIVIARHGQSMGDIECRFEGRADLELTDAGRHQAEKLAIWLSTNYTPNYIISSPLKRAAETAKIVGNRLGLDISYNDALMERDSGLLAGLTYDEGNAKYPVPKEPRMPHEPQCVTGESLLDFRFRAERFISELIFEYEKKETSPCVLLVSHGAMIDMMLQSFLKMPIKEDMVFGLQDTGLHLLKASKNGVFIDFLSSTAHLQ